MNKPKTWFKTSGKSKKRLIEKSDSTVCQVENPSKFRRHTHWATEIYEQSRHNCISLHNIAIALLLPLFNFNRSRASPSIKAIFSHLRLSIFWICKKLPQSWSLYLPLVGDITFCWLALFSRSEHHLRHQEWGCPNFAFETCQSH